MLKCEECKAWCCKYLMIKLPPFSMTSKAIEFYKVRGCEVKKGWIKIPFRCPHLDNNNMCMIY